MYLYYIAMSFQDNIKKWVLLDNQQKHLNDKLKEIREEKTNLSGDINRYIKNKNIENPTIQITDGSLKFVEVKTKMVEYILDYLKNNRTFKIENEIKRIYN
jgi:NurA-like 5'-3' nuclease